MNRRIPHADVAHQLQAELGLDLPPVALTLVSEPPQDIARIEGAVPAACALWRRAEHDVFYASAEDHFNCPIGAMVMGFSLPESTTKELMSLVGDMCTINYITPDEVPHIPKFEKPASGIVYGPLRRFPLDPDVVILWTTPAEAMLLQEAVGAAVWSENAAGAIFGRPGCGVLPTSVRRDTVTMSLGCAGMRTFTEISDNLCLVAMPGTRLPDLSAALDRTVAANAHLKEHYREQKARF